MIEAPMLTIGEVHTGLLHHSAAVSTDDAVRLLALVRGVRVVRTERPLAYAVSPEVVVGVDCQMISPSAAKVRVAGTAISRAVLTGGHVIQGSAFMQVRHGEAGRRLAWSHYLSRPGVVELLGRAAPADLAAGFLAASSPAGDTLDLSAISARALDAVQTNPALDHRPAFKSIRTRLRWAIAEPPGHGQAMTFQLHGRSVRTVRLPARQVPAVAVAADLCEELALHDWLLTTLLAHVDRARIGRAPLPAVVASLRPMIDHLLHLWMPAARTDAAFSDVWESLERRPGLSRQWHATVGRIRDQLALATIAMLRTETSG